ncbi:MAG: D-glycero-alpha-D-manno-heptose-1,7-bisphosphate 7-phosphatase [Chloroflexota bacterium]
MTAVFLDRDGVINENRPDHVKSWSEFRFLPGAPGAVARLTRSHVPVFVITNQAIINRRVVPVEVVEDVHRRMRNEIEAYGGHVVDIAYCPHRPDEGCICRKPQPGMILNLAAKYQLDLREAVVIGDFLTDIEAGQAAGCRTIMVQSGRGREQLQKLGDVEQPFAVAADLSAAVDLVLGGLLKRQHLAGIGVR